MGPLCIVSGHVDVVLRDAAMMCGLERVTRHGIRGKHIPMLKG